MSAAKIPAGYCHCGCGELTNLAPQTRSSRGWIKGQPKKFVGNHHLRLREVGERQRLEYRKRWKSEAPEIAYGYCQCGCGQPTLPHGSTKGSERVRGEPCRYTPGHGRLGKKTVGSLEIDCGYKTPCWIWQGGLTKGYAPRINVGGRKVYAYRAAYEEKYGLVPDGLELDHLCRTKACVNPDHLEPVSRQENIRRGLAATLTLEAASEIRALRESNPTLTHTKIGEMFGVGSTTVSDVLSGKRW